MRETEVVKKLKEKMKFQNEAYSDLMEKFEKSVEGKLLQYDRSLKCSKINL